MNESKTFETARDLAREIEDLMGSDGRAIAEDEVLAPAAAYRTDRGWELDDMAMDKVFRAVTGWDL